MARRKHTPVEVVEPACMPAGYYARRLEVLAMMINDHAPQEVLHEQAISIVVDSIMESQRMRKVIAPDGTVN